MRKLSNEELNRLSVEGYKNSEKTPLMVVLDNVRSLHNVGSVFRTGDAFLIEKMYLCGITATPPHKDIHKTALGATESVDWEYVPNTSTLVARLKREGIVTVAVEQAERAVKLDGFLPEKDKKYAFIFGNELTGVAQEVVSGCDAVVEIPQYGVKHSLNIAVSVGIVLWDFFCKVRK